MWRASLAATRATLASAEPFLGYCFRCTAVRYANPRDALSGEGALKASGRYHLRGKFRIVYLGCDLHTAVEEFAQTARHSGFDVAHLLPATSLGVHVNLSRVLNLTDPAVCAGLGVTREHLTQGAWGDGPREALTQRLGRFARAAGFEALLVPSSATSGSNLNYFPDRLLPGSFCEIVHPDRLPAPQVEAPV